VLIDVRRVSGNVQLFSCSGRGIDSWRDGTNFCRPKWGYYRSVLETKAEVRDEVILFDRFCISKGDVDDCERTFQ